jgi:hypothetical protein
VRRAFIEPVLRCQAIAESRRAPGAHELSQAPGTSPRARHPGREDRGGRTAHSFELVVAWALQVATLFGFAGMALTQLASIVVPFQPLEAIVLTVSVLLVGAGWRALSTRKLLKNSPPPVEPCQNRANRHRRTARCAATTPARVRCSAT